jgi:hypothetical protein
LRATVFAFQTNRAFLPGQEARRTTATATTRAFVLEVRAHDIDAFINLLGDAGDKLRNAVLTPLIDVLADPLGCLLFEAHVNSEYSAENLCFWLDVQRFERLCAHRIQEHNDQTKIIDTCLLSRDSISNVTNTTEDEDSDDDDEHNSDMRNAVSPAKRTKNGGDTFDMAVLLRRERSLVFTILDEYIKTSSKFAINLSSAIRRPLVDATFALRKGDDSVLDPGIFTAAATDVYLLMAGDTYGRFRRNKRYVYFLEASRARTGARVQSHSTSPSERDTLSPVPLKKSSSLMDEEWLEYEADHGSAVEVETPHESFAIQEHVSTSPLVTAAKSRDLPAPLRLGSAAPLNSTAAGEFVDFTFANVAQKVEDAESAIRLSAVRELTNIVSIESDAREMQSINRALDAVTVLATKHRYSVFTQLLHVGSSEVVGSNSSGGSNSRQHSSMSSKTMRSGALTSRRSSIGGGYKAVSTNCCKTPPAPETPPVAATLKLRAAAPTTAPEQSTPPRQWPSVVTESTSPDDVLILV